MPLLPATIAVIGDSQLESGAGPGSLAPTFFSHSPLTYGNSYLGWAFEIVHNGAVGGQTSAQILASVDDALALKPTILYFSGGGSNDVGACTTSQTIANLQAIADAAHAEGVLAVFQSVMPVDFPDAGALTRQGLINGWGRNRSRASTDFLFADCHSYLVDHITGAMIVDYSETTSGDVTHLAPRGKAIAGLAVAQTLQPLVFGRAQLAPCQGDPTNLVSYSHFHPSVSGNESLGPGYWSGVAAITALPGAVWSKVARANRSTKWQQLVMPVGSGARTIKSSTLAGVNTFEAGDVVFANLEYEVENSEDATASGVGITIAHSPDAVSTTIIGGCLAPLGSQKGPIHARCGVFQTPRVTVPAGVSGTALLQLSVTFLGGGTYRIDSAAIWNVTKNSIVYS